MGKSINKAGNICLILFFVFAFAFSSFNTINAKTMGYTEKTLKKKERKVDKAYKKMKEKKLLIKPKKKDFEDLFGKPYYSLHKGEKNRNDAIKKRERAYKKAVTNYNKAKEKYQELKDDYERYKKEFLKAKARLEQELKSNKNKKN